MERLIRSVSGYHLFKCCACHHRGWQRHRLLDPAPSEHAHRHTPGRPLERRDREAKRSAFVRSLLGFVLATGLGAASAVLLHGCQQRVDSETAVTSSE